MTLPPGAWIRITGSQDVPGSPCVAIRFPVPDEPLSVNDRRANPRSRGGAIALSRIRQCWRETAYAYATEADVAGLWPLRPSTVHVTLGFTTRRTRDPHNYTGTVVKWIIDGLVRAGVWPDDNPECITVADPVLEVGDYVTIEIRPRGDT